MKRTENEPLINETIYKTNKNYKNKNRKNKKQDKKNKTKFLNNKFLKIMYTNADSITNKLNEIETYANFYEADIILISEHLPKNPSNICNFNNVYHLDGYNCIENNKGRGVCIFYKNFLEVTLHEKVNQMFEPSLFINIKTEHKPLNIGLVYRSPNCDEQLNNKLNKQISFAFKKLNNLVIFGDFNHPSIDWEFNYCKKNEEHCASKFLFELTKLNISQVITSDTHHKPNCKPSLIDLILSKKPELLSNIKQNPPIAKSHHQVLTAQLSTDNSFIKMPTTKQKIIKPNFDKANFEALNTFFKEINWEELLKNNNVDDMWNIIKEKIEYAQKLYVPNKIIINNKNKPQNVTMDDNLHTLIKDKRYLFKIYKKYKTKRAQYNYNLARNRVSLKIKLLNKNKENKIAKNIKTNSKAFYQYIASKTVIKEGIYNLINKNGDVIKEDKDKCELLNDYFSSVFTTEDTDDIPVFKHNNDSLPSLETCTVTLKDMENAIHNLNANKSPGPDNFHPKFLKSCCKTLSLPFKILFDNTLHEGCIPTDWKIAEVRPIFKKGDKTNPCNYRPVSLTSVICKLFEKFIKESLNKHLTENNILSKEQFGFVSGRNTITQLLVTINDWMIELDNDNIVDAAYMDFRKAFDTVPHQRLITKLKSYNIKGPILNWIVSFLTGRTQYVKINNATSNNHKVTSGVPQGSVLGPTLFIYFINDLPNINHDSNIKIFADDTKAYNCIKNQDDVENLQKVIDEMFLWTQKWLLKFNKDKCKILHIGKKNPKNKYYVGSEQDKQELEDTDLEKDLGIFIDPNLDFKKHIKNIVKKASYLSYKILKNFTYRDANILVPLFKTLIRPILEYGNTIWANGIKKYKNLVENVQRKFTKYIKGLTNVPYEERLKSIKLPSLEFRLIRGDMIQVFKIANKYYDPITTNSIFNFSDNSRLRGHNFKIIKQITNKTKFSNFFTNRVVNTWNKLPSNIVNANSINEFKNLFDKHYHEAQYKINLDIY